MMRKPYVPDGILENHLHICLYICFTTNIPFRHCILLPHPNIFFYPSCISCSQPILFTIIFPFIYFSLSSLLVSLNQYPSFLQPYNSSKSAIFIVDHIAILTYTDAAGY